MKVDILNKKLEFNPAEDDFENIVYAIFKEANKSGRFIDYMIVDGVPVKHDFLGYLEKNIDDIKHVEVVSMSVKESIMTSLMGFNDFVMEQLSAVDILIENLSEEITPNAVVRMDSLIEGISIVSFQFDKIDATVNLNNLIPDYELWNELAVEIIKLRTLIPDMDYSMNTNDNKRLKNIIGENLKPILINMNRILARMISKRIK